MKIKRRRQSFIESSALSDMAFLLIVYFIVIAGFNVNQGFLLDLPKKDSVRMVQRDELLRFRLDPEGRILSGSGVVDYGQAAAEIAAAAKPGLAVALTVSPEAPWQSVVSFISLAQRLAVDSFSFSMEKNEAPDGGGQK